MRKPNLTKIAAILALILALAAAPEQISKGYAHWYMLLTSEDVSETMNELARK